MSDNGHAKLSPSSADRWMSCSGSVVLSAGMPSKSSKFSSEGTCAHALAEACLVDELPAQAFVGVPFEYDDHGEKMSVVIEQDMADNVQVYVDHVQSIPGKLHVEVKVKVTEDIYGTADAIIWSPADALLTVKDLKFGAGVPVEAEGNLQLKIYALAALLTMKYPAHFVDVGIVQPRCFHPAGPVRTVRFDVVDLLDFHADLLDAAERVATAKRSQTPLLDWPDNFLAPSEKGCRWCLAAPKCPALKSKAQTLAKQVFAPGVAYDAAALAETLDFLPILEGWIKNTREFAYGEAEQGREIPQWKLVEKVANRKFKPGIEVDLAKALEVEPDALYKPREMLGVTDIQKLAPGKNDKLRAEVLAPFVTKESSGHTLVHESDKRPAVKLDAASAFSNL